MQHDVPIVPSIERRTFLGGLFGSAAVLLGFKQASASATATSTASSTPASTVKRAYHHSTKLPADAGYNSYSDYSNWHELPRIPISASSEAHEALLIEAIQRNEALYGTYTRWGNSNIRRITPLLLFYADTEDERPEWVDVIDPGPIYLQAWDHDRQAPRTFQAEHFNPLFTAPWMQTHAKESEQSNWPGALQQAEAELRREGIAPVATAQKF